MSHPKLITKEYKLPFIFITSLFFLWGLAHGMLDTLDKHFQQILHLQKLVLAIGKITKYCNAIKT